MFAYVDQRLATVTYIVHVIHTALVVNNNDDYLPQSMYEN